MLTIPMQSAAVAAPITLHDIHTLISMMEHSSYIPQGLLGSFIQFFGYVLLIALTLRFAWHQLPNAYGAIAWTLTKVASFFLHLQSLHLSIHNHIKRGIRKIIFWLLRD